MLSKKLHFPLNNIVIFAWSIGGYSACWTAVHYPDIQGLILDAIFDDVLPLAQRRMPLSTLEIRREKLFDIISI